MSSVIIAVVVVLGIIVAGGFLLYFMGDLLMSISGKKKDSDAVKEKQRKDQQELEDRVNALENSEEIRKDPEIATVLYNGSAEEETQEEEPAEEAPVEEEQAEEPQEETEEIDDTEEYIRRRRKELLERLAKMQEENAEEPEEESDVVDLNETQQEEETEEEAPVEEAPAEEPAPVETVEEQPAEEQPAEETPAEEPAEEQPAETPAEEPAEAPATRVVTVTAPENLEGVDALVANFTIEELEKRLADEQERLKQNEKELRKNKKEFIPLRRVKTTLENDEKKLRRKEALVAKQKVVLYGVNNYADIDEEKAQKLAEDLDLLDGLKLSVQHCQEVMEKNQERYPLLEQIYNLLSSQNAQIKQDIKNIQEAIERLKAENPDAE